jgi:hypothetical protein
MILASEGVTYWEPAPAHAGKTTCERPHAGTGPHVRFPFSDG